METPSPTHTHQGGKVQGHFAAAAAAAVDVAAVAATGVFVSS